MTHAGAATAPSPPHHLRSTGLGSGASDTEKRFCARLGLEVLDADLRDLAGLAVAAAA